MNAASPEPESAFLEELASLHSGPDPFGAALERTVRRLKAESGTIHVLVDGRLQLRAHTAGMPEAVLEIIRTIPVGKGMAGLAVERCAPVTACNLQTDASGDVRPGARATGLRGSIVVPILSEDRAVGALGVANREERTFDAREVALLLAVGRILAPWGA